MDIKKIWCSRSKFKWSDRIRTRRSTSCFSNTK